MTFLADESGVETSEGREGIELVLPSGTAYRLATGTRNETFDGEAYTAEPIQRGSIGIISPGRDWPVEIHMPVASAFFEVYATTRPARVLVTIWRKQPTGEQVVLRGLIAGASVSENTVRFSVASRTLSFLERQLPVITVGLSCPVALYGPVCNVARASFKVTTTIVLVTGRTITVASMGAHADNWAQFGELLHVTSGERMTIAEQIGTLIRLQLPISGSNTGDTVEIYAGCDRSIATCDTKFTNTPNFRGQPDLPRVNPVLTAGFGVYTSE